MPPTHAKKPAAMKMCAHGGPLQCDMGCYADGGKIERKGETYPWKGEHSSSTGVNAPLPTRETAGWHGHSQSEAGHRVRTGNKYGADMASSKKLAYADAKSLHHQTLSEMRADKTDRRNLAEGGDVEPLDEPMEDSDHEEIESVLAEELLTAMEKKDKKGVVSAIEALVLQCMNKAGG